MSASSTNSMQILMALLKEAPTKLFLRVCHFVLIGWHVFCSNVRLRVSAYSTSRAAVPFLNDLLRMCSRFLLSHKKHSGQSRTTLSLIILEQIEGGVRACLQGVESVARMFARGHLWIEARCLSPRALRLATILGLDTFAIARKANAALTILPHAKGLHRCDQTARTFPRSMQKFRGMLTGGK
jgi:hypothetical protein